MENTECRYYTLEEISKRDGKQDPRTWLIIKDVVYDVTDFLEDHPGGAELVTEWAGKDGTKEFNDFGHSSDAKRELKTMKIGEVVADQRNKKKPNDQLAKRKETKIVEYMDPVRRQSCISIITCGIFT